MKGKTDTTYDFQKLWHILMDLNMTKKELANRADISVSSLARLKKGYMLSYDRMKRICNAVGCGELSEIMEERR